MSGLPLLISTIINHLAHSLIVQGPPCIFYNFHYSQGKILLKISLNNGHSEENGEGVLRQLIFHTVTNI